MRKETFPRFSAVCIFWHTLIAFSLYIFIDFSAQNCSLSLFKSSLLLIKGCLACASNDLKREGQIKRSSPVLIYSQVLLFPKKKPTVRHVNFIVLTNSLLPRISYNNKKTILLKENDHKCVDNEMKWTKMGIFFRSLF